MKLLIVFTLMTVNIFAGKYGEHKKIGDIAFNEVMLTLQFKINQIHHSKLFWRHLGLHEKNHFEFGSINFNGITSSITYGDLTGLSGDHAENPFELYDDIKNEFSRLKQVIKIHREYIKNHHYDAPDLKVNSLDKKYASLAINDLSHFYKLGYGIDEHYAFDKDLFNTLKNMESISLTFDRLKRMNSMEKYILLHTVAIELSKDAGRLFKDDKYYKLDALKIALYINAFADHYLQDSFSAGHRVVNRSVAGSITSDKTLHDYFGKHGIRSLNFLGDSWFSHGDSDYNKSIWKKDILLKKNSTNLRIAIEANKSSIEDIFQAFINSYNGGVEHFKLSKYTTVNYDSIFLIEENAKFDKALADEKRKSYYSRLYEIFKYRSVKLMPIPYGVDFDEYKEIENKFIHDKRDLHEEVSLKQYSKKNYFKFGPINEYKNIKKFETLLSQRIPDLNGNHKENLSLKSVKPSVSFYFNGIIHNFEYDSFNFKNVNKITFNIDLGYRNTFLEDQNKGEFLLRYQLTLSQILPKLSFAHDIGFTTDLSSDITHRYSIITKSNTNISIFYQTNNYNQTNFSGISVDVDGVSNLIIRQFLNIFF